MSHAMYDNDEETGTEAVNTAQCESFLHKMFDRNMRNMIETEREEDAADFCCSNVHSCAAAGNCLFEMGRTEDEIKGLLAQVQKTPDETKSEDEWATQGSVATAKTKTAVGWSRFNYMAGDCDYRTYYGQFVDLEIAELLIRFLGREGLEEAHKSKALDHVQSRQWDMAAIMLPHETKEHMRELGEPYTINSARHVLMESALQFIEDKWVLVEKEETKK